MNLYISFINLYKPIYIYVSCIHYIIYINLYLFLYISYIEYIYISKRVKISPYFSFHFKVPKVFCVTYMTTTLLHIYKNNSRQASSDDYSKFESNKTHVSFCRNGWSTSRIS